MVAVAVSIILYLHFNKLEDFEPLIKKKLINLVKNASDGLYHLEIEKLEVNVLNSSITLINVHVRPDTLVYAEMEKSRKAPNDVFDVSVSRLEISDIVPADFLSARVINLRRLFIDKPVIKVWHKKQPYNIQDDSVKTVYQQIRKDISGIKVDTIILQNIDFTYNNQSRNKQTQLLNVNIFFTDILIDSSTQFDRQRFLFAKNCMISVKDYKSKTTDNLYGISIQDIQIRTARQAIKLSGLRFEPMLSEKKFYQRVRHQQDIFTMSIREINFTAVNWWAILAEESFVSDKISMSKGNIKIYNDKSQTPDTRSKIGKYPQQLLMQLPFTLKLDTVQLTDFDLSYTELNPKSGRTGTLSFSKVHGTLTNITNDSLQILKNPLLKLTANASFLKQAPLTTLFTFDLANYRKGNFTVYAKMGALNQAALNEITVPLALLKLNSLMVKSLEVSMKGDNLKGKGTVKLIYSDLNITALKSTDMTLKKRGLLSLIANAVIIKKDNPLHGKTVRTEMAEFKRDPNKSFFNLVWKTIFTGAAQTVGYNKK